MDWAGEAWKAWPTGLWVVLLAFGLLGSLKRRGWRRGARGVPTVAAGLGLIALAGFARLAPLLPEPWPMVSKLMFAVLLCGCLGVIAWQLIFHPDD
jgi:hypothetical protein